MRRTKTFGLDQQLGTPAVGSGAQQGPEQQLLGAGIAFAVPAGWGVTVANAATATHAQLVPPPLRGGCAAAAAAAPESYSVAAAPLGRPAASARDPQFRALADAQTASVAPCALLASCNDLAERPGAAAYVYAGTDGGTGLAVKALYLCVPLGSAAVFVAGVGEASVLAAREADLLRVFTSLRSLAAEPVYAHPAATPLVGAWAEFAQGGLVRKTVVQFLADGRFSVEDCATHQVRGGMWRVAGSRLQLAFSDGAAAEQLWRVTSNGLTTLLQTSPLDGSSLTQWSRI